MGYNIPEKIFDQHMHIVRDVHFDVDKYKVGELYVINQKDPGYLSVQNKTIGQLADVNEHELKFKVLALNYDHKTGDSYNTYSISGLRFTIDDIIERCIEIERLLTETDATGVLYNESKETTYTSEDLKKYDAMLGYGKAAHDKFWGDFGNCNSTIPHDAYRLDIERDKCPSKNDVMLKEEIRHITDGFEDKRFAIGAMLSMIIDIACGAAKKTCANCPLSEDECSEISGLATDILSDNEQRGLVDDSDEWDQED